MAWWPGKLEPGEYPNGTECGTCGAVEPAGGAVPTIEGPMCRPCARRRGITLPPRRRVTTWPGADGPPPF